MTCTEFPVNDPSTARRGTGDWHTKVGPDLVALRNQPSLRETRTLPPFGAASSPPVFIDRGAQNRSIWQAPSARDVLKTTGWTVSWTCIARGSRRTQMAIPSLASPLRLGLQALFEPPEQNPQAVAASGHR
jgi:hypothetical protein